MTKTTTIIALGAALALTACGHGRGREYGTPDFQRVAVQSLGEGTGVVIARDRATGCEWFWTRGRRPGQMQPRIGEGSRQRCDPEPGMRGFRAMSRSRVGKDTVAVIRDDDTGCDWLFADGKGASGLVPRLNAHGMICQGK